MICLNEDSPEVITAIQAIQAASELCQKVSRELPSMGALQKSDRSPVTVADFGSQAIICRIIRERFPGDPIVAEEDSEALRDPKNSRALDLVTLYVKESLTEATSEKVCSWIDYSSQTPDARFWTLDPIDGTKGFLRGDQYAIALALIEKGEVRLGLLGCPNLYSWGRPTGTQKGCLFLALKGKGAVQTNMKGEERTVLSVSNVADPSGANFAESFEPDHADHLAHLRLAKKLNITAPSLRMDSQAKYGLVARGEAALYLRIPSPDDPAYREKIWDHAAGSIIAEEAGGKVTDLKGQALDFLHGIRMERNVGILVSNRILHEVVLKTLEF